MCHVNSFPNLFFKINTDQKNQLAFALKSNIGKRSKSKRDFSKAREDTIINRDYSETSKINEDLSTESSAFSLESEKFNSSLSYHLTREITEKRYGKFVN